MGPDNGSVTAIADVGRLSARKPWEVVRQKPAYSFDLWKCQERYETGSFTAT